MRILIVTGIYPPDIGGPSSYVPRMAKALSIKGHFVKVICLSDIKNYNYQENYEVIRILRSTFIPLRMLLTIISIYRNAKKIDIIFSNSLQIESVIAAKLLKKPIVQKIVGDPAWEKARNLNLFYGTIDEFQVASKNIVLRFFEFIFKLPFSYSSANFVPSNYLMKIVHNWKVTRKKFPIVIYNSVDSYKYDIPKVINEKLRIVTVCRLVAWKGIEEILETIKSLNVNFVVIGTGPEEERYKSISHALGIANRVEFKGNLTHDETIREIYNSDIFILNSTYEGLPHVILEAMVVKTFVICRDAGGCNEIVHHKKTGYLINKDSLNNSILQGINYYIENEHERNVIIENAYRNIIEYFSFEKMYNRTINLLEDIINDSRR